MPVVINQSGNAQAAALGLFFDAARQQAEKQALAQQQNTFQGLLQQVAQRDQQNQQLAAQQAQADRQFAFDQAQQQFSNNIAQKELDFRLAAPERDQQAALLEQQGKLELQSSLSNTYDRRDARDKIYEQFERMAKDPTVPQATKKRMEEFSFKIQAVEASQNTTPQEKQVVSDKLFAEYQDVLNYTPRDPMDVMREQVDMEDAIEAERFKKSGVIEIDGQKFIRGRYGYEPLETGPDATLLKSIWKETYGAEKAILRERMAQLFPASIIGNDTVRAKAQDEITRLQGKYDRIIDMGTFINNGGVVSAPPPTSNPGLAGLGGSEGFERLLDPAAIDAATATIDQNPSGAKARMPTTEDEVFYAPVGTVFRIPNPKGGGFVWARRKAVSQ